MNHRQMPALILTVSAVALSSTLLTAADATGGKGGQQKAKLKACIDQELALENSSSYKLTSDQLMQLTAIVNSEIDSVSTKPTEEEQRKILADIEQRASASAALRTVRKDTIDKMIKDLKARADANCVGKAKKG